MATEVIFCELNQSHQKLIDSKNLIKSQTMFLNIAPNPLRLRSKQKLSKNVTHVSTKSPKISAPYASYSCLGIKTIILLPLCFPWFFFTWQRIYPHFIIIVIIIIVIIIIIIIIITSKRYK